VIGRGRHSFGSLDGFVVLCVQGPPDTRSSRCHCNKNVIFNNRIVVEPVGCFEMGKGEGESRVFNRVTTDIRECVSFCLLSKGEDMNVACI